MRVNEIFHSIQGEGLNAGIPMTFIRLQGCNLTCKWCDTKYALVSGGEELKLEQIVEQVEKTSTGWICITGGEPLMQAEELCNLVDLLRQRNHQVEIETNGSYKRPVWRDSVACWATDVKCPSSGNLTDETILADWFQGPPTSSIKFVVADARDLIYATKVLRTYQMIAGGPQIIVSPMNPIGSLGILPEWYQKVWNFAVDQNIRFSLQLHRLVWGSKRGV